MRIGGSLPLSPSLGPTRSAAATSAAAVSVDRVELAGDRQPQPAPPQSPTTPPQAPPDSPPGPTPPAAPELVKVGHRRELRGAWVATVWNINFPSNPKSDAETQKREMVAMLDRLKECGFNAVFFQVRPEGDALYSSQLEPWSNSLTGKQGQDPGYDPLATMIDEAHKRNLEVHAWMNPYRASAASSTQVAPHIAVEHPEVVHKYGSGKWMDPGSEVVRQKLVDVCRDVTQRYDVDGIHFDDYFYPYPNGTEFPDQATWNAYKQGGGTLSRADWRRENVNQAIRQVHQAITEEKDHVRFGISPFGIPAPDKPNGITGFDQYEGLYADTQKWMDEGIVDYLAPQLYWATTQPRQAYGTLLNWWADHTKEGRYIFAGNNLDALGSSSRWSVDEYRKEVDISRAKHAEGSQGNIWWNVGPILENRKNIVDVFRREFYPTPALTPPLAVAAQAGASPPQISQDGARISLHHTDAEPLRAWTVYRPDGDGWKLDRIVPGEESSLDLGPGRWAVAAATRQGVESPGVVVTV